MLMRDSGRRVEVQLSPESAIAELRLMAFDDVMKQVFLPKANRRILAYEERIGDAGIRPGSIIFINPEVIPSSVPLGSRVQFAQRITRVLLRIRQDGVQQIADIGGARSGVRD
jgi:hypothetical protein